MHVRVHYGGQIKKCLADTFDYKILMGPFQVESPHIQPISLCLSVLRLIYKYLTSLQSNTRTGRPIETQAHEIGEEQAHHGVWNSFLSNIMFNKL